MTTPRDLIKGALQLIEVIDPTEDVDGDEITTLFARFNRMLSGLSAKKPLIYADTLVSHALSAGTGVYTIGSGAAIDTTRPTTIKTAYVRDSAGNDSPVDVIDEYEYSRIYDKDHSEPYPEKLYYNPAYPTGTIKLWPYPSQAYTLYMEVNQPLTAFTGLSQTVSLPEGYEEMLENMFAKHVGPSYGRAGTPGYAAVSSLADEKLADIKRANQANDRYEAEICAPGSGRYTDYDVYSRRYR